MIFSGEGVCKWVSAHIIQDWIKTKTNKKRKRRSHLTLAISLSFLGTQTVIRCHYSKQKAGEKKMRKTYNLNASLQQMNVKKMEMLPKQMNISAKHAKDRKERLANEGEMNEPHQNTLPMLLNVRLDDQHNLDTIWNPCQSYTDKIKTTSTHYG